VISLACIPHTSLGLDPGEGEGATRGYEACAPLIAALEEFHKVNGNYPDSIEVLIPDYLDKVPPEVNGDPIIFILQGDTYTLSFSYSGPGNKICIYAPEDGWHCSGVY
jgi:hypothetical protein